MKMTKKEATANTRGFWGLDIGTYFIYKGITGIVIYTDLGDYLNLGTGDYETMDSGAQVTPIKIVEIVYEEVKSDL